MSPELDLQNWFSGNSLPGMTNTLAWVYQTPITALDIAAHGPMTSAGMSFVWPKGLVNSVGASYGTDSNSGTPGPIAPLDSGDPMDPAFSQKWMDDMREQLSAMPGAASAFSGSNTFAWSGLYCQDASGETYPGLLGDPHQPVPPPIPWWNLAFAAGRNHLWFAHIKVTPPGATSPSLDVLGHFPHASATNFTSHNRHVAMGGTLGAPNFLDEFLLRLEEDSSGAAASSLNYYSRYHDVSGTNLPSQPLAGDSITIKHPNGPVDDFAVTFWRAGSYGIVLPLRADVDAAYDGTSMPTMPPVVYGERVTPAQAPPWRVSVLPAQSDPMRFWSNPYPQTGPLETSPMVVALRAPIDAAVAGEDMHMQLMRDFWEMAHAGSVAQVLSSTNGGAYRANVCFQDRTGQTFTSTTSAIPERGGSNTAFLNRGYHTLDKWGIYSGWYGPVPARHSTDDLFDWQFGSIVNQNKPQPLLYLDYTQANPPLAAFKPSTFQAQLALAYPPTAFAAPGNSFWIEGGFFASAVNDTVWGYSRKRDVIDIISAPAPFGNITVANNQLFQWVLDQGVAYSTPLISLEGPDRQQIVVSRFTQQAERIIRGAPHGLPPLTPAEMRDFVVTPELYAERDYELPPQVTAYNPPLPVAIRQLREVADNPGYTKQTWPSGRAFESPLVTAQKEVDFFNDLWDALFGVSLTPNVTWDQHVVAGSSSPQITLSLRDLWINGNATGQQDKIFWYEDPAIPSTLRWIDLPPEFPLIDFYWRGSEVGRTLTVGDLDASILGSTGGIATGVASLVNGTLVPWDGLGAHYQNLPTSTGACLLEMMSQGYGAATDLPTYDYGRHWVRLRNGEVEDVIQGWVPLANAAGQSGAVPAGANSLVQQHDGWSSLRTQAFPFSQIATLLDAPEDSQVPYTALYANVATRQVRTTLGPDETNALVKYFLQLGRHYVDPAANNFNPSRKLARYQMLGSDPDEFRTKGYPSTYPLTDGQKRLTALQALLDTEVYLNSISASGIPPFSVCFRARAYDHNGLVWPPPSGPVNDLDCVGAALRAVTWTPALDPNLDPGSYQPGRGYQEKFLGLGGSISTMVAMFPTNGTTVDSYFWSTPGQEVMAGEPLVPAVPSRFEAHMVAFSTNVLLPTHYDDFMNHIAWSVVHTY